MGGRIAVSQTILNTKSSASMLYRRRFNVFLRSEYRTHLGIDSSASFGGESFRGRKKRPPCSPMTTRSHGKFQGHLAVDDVAASTNGQGAAEGDKVGGGKGDKIGNASDYALASALASFPTRSSSLAPDVEENDTSGDCSGADSSLVFDPAMIENQGSRRGREVPTTFVSGEIESKQDDDVGAYESDGGTRRRPRGGGGRDGESTQKERSAAIVIGEVLGSLPLSKLKIVLGRCIQQTQVSDRPRNPRARRYRFGAL